MNLTLFNYFYGSSNLPAFIIDQGATFFLITLPIRQTHTQEYAMIIFVT